MKRFHVHVSVDDLQKNIRFYSTMFGAEPSVVKDDYAKWMLDDPRINFAISQRGREVGLNHLGVQVDSEEELGALRDQLAAADAGMVAQSEAACCYAKSDKYWTVDPQGIAWETYHTYGEIPIFGADTLDAAESGCCAPAPSATASAAVAKVSTKIPVRIPIKSAAKSGSSCC